MRPLASPARLRRQLRLLAYLPIGLTLALAGCFAGESIASASAGPVAGAYALSMWSYGPLLEPLPMELVPKEDETGEGEGEAGEEGEKQSAVWGILRRATLDILEDGTYSEIYEIEVWTTSPFDPTEEVLVEVEIQQGSGKWTHSETGIVFTAISKPQLYEGVTSWTGRLGDGRHFALNVQREGPFVPWYLHYRRL